MITDQTSHDLLRSAQLFDLVFVFERHLLETFAFGLIRLKFTLQHGHFHLQPGDPFFLLFQLRVHHGNLRFFDEELFDEIRPVDALIVSKILNLFRARFVLRVPAFFQLTESVQQFLILASQLRDEPLDTAERTADAMTLQLLPSSCPRAFDRRSRTANDRFRTSLSSVLREILFGYRSESTVDTGHSTSLENISNGQRDRDEFIDGKRSIAAWTLNRRFNDQTFSTECMSAGGGMRISEILIADRTDCVHRALDEKRKCLFLSTCNELALMSHHSLLCWIFHHERHLFHGKKPPVSQVGFFTFAVVETSMSAYEYVDEASIDSDLLCSICREPCQDPQCTSCEHLFCLRCITRWQTGTLTSCPNCRRRFNRTNLRPASVLIEQLLKKLRVKCQQCGRTDLVRATIDEHLRSDCLKSIVSCPAATDRCSWTGQRDQLDEHLTHCLCESFPSAIEQFEATGREFTAKVARLEARREGDERALQAMMEEFTEWISTTKEMRTIDLSTAKSQLDECQRTTQSTGELLSVLEAQGNEIRMDSHFHRQATADFQVPFERSEIQIKRLTTNLQLMKGKTFQWTATSNDDHSGFRASRQQRQCPTG